MRPLVTVFGCRPMGTALLLAAVDKQGPQLYLIEPSGTGLVRIWQAIQNLVKCTAKALGPVTMQQGNTQWPVPHSQHPGHWLHYLACTMLQRYFGTAVGKGRQAAKTEIERLNLGELTCRQGVMEVAKMCVFCPPTDVISHGMATLISCMSYCHLAVGIPSYRPPLSC